MANKLNTAYTINYIIVANRTEVGNGESSIEVTNHREISASYQSKQEVVQWIRLFGDDPSVRLVSIIRHTDHVMERHEINEWLKAVGVRELSK